MERNKEENKKKKKKSEEGGGDIFFINKDQDDNFETLIEHLITMGVGRYSSESEAKGDTVVRC